MNKESTNHHRKINVEDINVPKGYKVEVFAKELNTPINMIFTPDNEIFVADAGVTDNNGKVLKYINNTFKVIADGFNPPLAGINYLDGNIFVSHRGKITVVKPDGSKVDIIEGLPSLGDHHNNRVVFGADGKMYFGQGTATNSAVVGEDNKDWVKKHPYFHDYPGGNITLNGYNYKSENFLTAIDSDYTFTGAYSPFRVESECNEVVKGITAASGSILRANVDGSNLELVAWGLRNPFRLKFDRFNRLFSTNHGMDIRGSRPVANSPDEFQLIYPGVWYGWPDFTGGLPVTLPVFKPENEPSPKFLLSEHPMIPPRPFSVFTPHAAVMGFDFNYTYKFKHYGDVYIAEFGSEAPRTTGGKPLPGVGHRVSRIDMNTGFVYTFAINKSGYPASYTDGGGFERPIDIVFGPDEDMYVVDFGLGSEGHHGYEGNTGVIWKITKKS